MLFYKCKGCGNFVTFLDDKSGCTPKCCGETMEQLIANSSDGAGEKHVPIVKQEGNNVNVMVGSVTHPMLDYHYIQWIILEIKKRTPNAIFKIQSTTTCLFYYSR